MTELVINAPHLQTGSQRLGAILVAVSGWLLWCYFFFPLVALTGWLLDFDVCSPYVNLSGGYLNLCELLGLYALVIVGMAGLWGLWAVYNRIQRALRPARIVHAERIDLKAVSVCFGVDADALAMCRQARFATVYYDASGAIRQLRAGEPE